MYILSFIYNIISRRLLPTVPNVAYFVALTLVFKIWSSNFRHGLLKSLLSEYALPPDIFALSLYGYPFLVETSIERIFVPCIVF